MLPQEASTALDFAFIILPLLVSVLISPEMFDSFKSNVFLISLHYPIQLLSPRHLPNRLNLQVLG